MQEQLNQIYQIEPETKLNKLDKKLKELQHAVQEYRNTGDIYPVLEEVADCLIIILGIFIVKHSGYIREFMIIVERKIKRSLKIKRIMKRENKTYDEIRRRI